MQSYRSPLSAISRVNQDCGADRSARQLRATVQIGFDFPDVGAQRSKDRRAIQEASNVVVQTLDRLCEPGHSMLQESTVLMHAEHRSSFDRATLTHGLRRAVRQRQIAREEMDGMEWLFPRAVRDAELTVARCVRQLAEGSPLVRSERARLEKVSLVCSSAPFATTDVMRRMLIRLNCANCWPVPVVQGTDAAQWYRWKLGRRVLESGEWLLRQHGQARHDISQPSEPPIFVLLDASRLGLESMAEILEAIPPEASLMLVGDPNEGPRSGHGQPFRDLVSTALFQCVRLTATVPQAETVSAAAPARRSALCWRLRRGAGLSSKFRWGPVAAIDVDGEMS